MRIHGRVSIARPVAEVFDFVADQTNEPRYNPMMLRSTKVTPGPLGVGTLFEAETTMRGRRVPMAIEITAFDRPSRLASTTHMSTMDITGQLSFTATPQGTDMRWDWDLHPLGATRALGPLIAAIGRRQEGAIWTSLKEYLEHQPNSA